MCGIAGVVRHGGAVGADPAAALIQALVGSGQVERAVDPAGVLGFLAWGMVPPTLTCVAGVESLAPGTLTRWSADGARVRRPFADVATAYERPL